MKKILLILTALMVVVSSCTEKKPVVKKERIYCINEIDINGSLYKNINNTITEYNKNGYVTQIYSYGKDGNLIYESSYTYNGKKNTDIRIISKYYGGSYNKDEEVSLMETYYDKDKEKWVRKYNETITDVNPVQFEGLTDDLITIRTNSFKLDEDVIYKGQYTKYDDNGNWIEAEDEMIITLTGSVTKFNYVREILEVWD